MNKNVFIGLALLILIIGAGLGWYYFQGAGSTPQGSFGYDFAKPEPIRIAGFGGLALEQVDLGDGPVPLVVIPLDFWGGYSALLAANGGSEPNTESYFYKNHRFAVRIVREDQNIRQLEGFASGRYHFIWSGMDTLPLLYEALRSDRRVLPQVVGLFDWSLGGDGIVVRQSVQRSTDLKGKIVLTSMVNAYPFMLLWYLAQVDINPLDVKIVHIDDVQRAFDVFKGNKDIAAWVTWEPYLSNIADSNSEYHVPETRMLINSRDASQLIADVMVTRADLIREQPQIVKGIVAGLFHGEQLLRENPTAIYQILARFYQLPGGAAEARELLEGIHIPNLTEARMFFNPDNSLGAHKIFYMAQEYYKMLGILDTSVSFEAERVIWTEGVEALAANSRWANQPNRILSTFNRQNALGIGDLESQRVILNNDIKLYFEAQRIDFDLNSDRQEIKENLRLLARVSEQLKVLGTASLKLIGHLDTGRVEEFRQKGPQAFVEASSQAKLISKRRAEFVKKVMVERFGVEADRIITEGRGWDQPLDPNDPAANRRVEVQFVSFE